MTNTSVGRQDTERRRIRLHLLGFLLFAPFWPVQAPS